MDNAQLHKILYFFIKFGQTIFIQSFLFFDRHNNTNDCMITPKHVKEEDKKQLHITQFICKSIFINLVLLKTNKL